MKKDNLLMLIVVSPIVALLVATATYLDRKGSGNNVAVSILCAMALNVACIPWIGPLIARVSHVERELAERCLQERVGREHHDDKAPHSESSRATR